MATEFVVFANGISFLVTSSNAIQLTFHFAGFTISTLNTIYLVSVFQTIELSTETKKTMSQVWQMAEECVSDPHAVIPSDESMKMRESLKFYLLTESVVPAKACGTIVIDRSLTLNFFAQVIPFTVMLFTTIKEMERKLSDNKSCC